MAAGSGLGTRLRLSRQRLGGSPIVRRAVRSRALVQMAASVRTSESVCTEKSNLRQKLESSFPLDALLPELHTKNVLTDYEFTQLLPTPQSAVVDRNRKFLDYLANKGPSAVSDTLSVLFRHQYEAYGYFGEMLCEVFGEEGEEGEGMRGKTSRKPQQGGERGSGAKETTSPPPGALGPPPPRGAAVLPMSPWNHQALVSLRGELQLSVLMESGFGNRLEMAAGGFMTRFEAQTVREQPGNIKQMDKVIDILLGKADKDFTTFLKMLQDSNNKVWAEELAKRAEQFREEGGECASTLLEAVQSGWGTTTREGIALRSLRTKGEGPARTTPDKSLRAKLGCYYNKACIQDNPLLASSTMQYVKLNLVQPEQRRPVEGRVGETVAVHLAKGGVQQVPHEKVSLEYQDILAFTPPTGISRQRVLIEGVAGSGKSTLTQRMCCDYSNGRFARDYNVVIHVALRSLPKDQQKLTLQDLIFTSVGEADIVEEVAASITSCQGQAVLFIFDGFDELSEEMRERSLVRDIIKGHYLPQSSFVVTTRPISAESLYHCVDRRVVISGFGKEEVKKYVIEYFASSNPSAGEKLLSTLSLRPHIERLCYVPLLLLMVCYIVSLDGDSAELPRTLHQLFEYLIILTLNHNLERAGRKERAGSLRDVSRLCPSFDKLTQLALEGIEKDTIIFFNLDFEVDSAFLGLFNCIATRNRFGVISHTWHFLHLAVQEYMAALAVAKKTSEEQVTFWKQHLTLKYNKKGHFVLTQDRYYTMFLFYSGLTGLNTPGIQSMLLDTLNTVVEPRISESNPLPDLIAVVAESGNVQLAQSILSPCGPTDVYCCANVDVAWCVIEYCKQVDGAAIRISDADIAIFFSQLGDISTLGKLEVLRFGYEPVPPTVRQFLLKQTQLKCVMFGKLKDIAKDVIDTVKDVLTHHKELLEEVTLEGSYRTGVRLAPLVDSLVACTRLTSLELASVNLSVQSLLAVAKGLHNLRALGLEKVALLDDRPPTTSDVHLIASSVEHHPSLREVTVRELCSESLVKGAVEGMARRHGVEKLVVIQRRIAPALVPPICAVMRAGSLKTLEIDVLSEPDQVEQVLEELPHCTHLSKLQLWLSLSDEVVTLPSAVEAGLSKCTALQKLTVVGRESGFSAGIHPSVTAALLKAVTVIRSLEEVTLHNCDFDSVDEEVIGYLSHLKKFKQLRKVEMTDCRILSPSLIATICGDLCSSMDEVEVTLEVTTSWLQGEDVTDPDVLKAVEAAVRRSTSVKRIKIEGSHLRWTNVATAILKGAAQSKPLREVELVTPRHHPPLLQEVVDYVRKANPKLRLVVTSGNYHPDIYDDFTLL